MAVALYRYFKWFQRFVFRALVMKAKEEKMMILNVFKEGKLNLLSPWQTSTCPGTELRSPQSLTSRTCHLPRQQLHRSVTHSPAQPLPCSLIVLCKVEQKELQATEPRYNTWSDAFLDEDLQSNSSRVLHNGSPRSGGWERFVCHWSTNNTQE